MHILMCVYIYTYICIHMFIYLYNSLYRRFAVMNQHIYIHIFRNICIDAYIHTCVYKYIFAYKSTCTYQLIFIYLKTHKGKYQEQYHLYRDLLIGWLPYVCACLPCACDTPTYLPPATCETSP